MKETIDRILKAEAEAKGIVEEAKKEARRVLEEARAGQSELLDSAREEARRRIREDLEKVKTDAGLEGKAIIEEARKRAQLLIDGAVLKDHGLIETCIRRVGGLER